MTAQQATQAEFEAWRATHAAYRRGEASWDDVVACCEAYCAAWQAWYATQPPPAPYTEADCYAL